VAKVYFEAVEASNPAQVSKAAARLLAALVEAENITLADFIPLKVHCGEKGNTTFIRPANYEGIIDYLQERKIGSKFMETNVLYRGERNSSANHLKIAREHGFTRLPFEIADGERGEKFRLVEIKKKHFAQCKIAEGLAEHDQVIVLSHFKGHAFAGFGGALKQLAMGFAARGGKLDQHANAIPKINAPKCKACNACTQHCPTAAITVAKKAKINEESCIGCASCLSVCPYEAVTFSWLPSMTNAFHERLAEYAYAAAAGKNHLYLNFAMQMTKGCDCEGHNMKIIARDLGVLASTDPVAIDQACLDLVAKQEGKDLFGRGRHALAYAEKIGLGNRAYELVQL